MLAAVLTELIPLATAPAEASDSRASDLGEILLFAGSLGAMYAFIALGYTMVYGIIKLINFAHGEFFMMGAFAAVWALSDIGISYAIGFPVGTVAHYAFAFLFAGFAAGMLAILTERVAYRPLRGGRAPFTTAFVLMGLGLFLLFVNLPIRDRLIVDIRTTPVEQQLLGVIALLFGIVILLGRSGLHLSRFLVLNRNRSVPSTPNTVAGNFRDWALKPPKTRLPAGRLAALLTAVGVSLFLQSFGVQLFESQAIPMPPPKRYHNVEALEPQARIEGSISADVRSMRYRVYVSEFATVVVEYLEHQQQQWDETTAPFPDAPAKTLREGLAVRAGVVATNLDFAQAVRGALERELRDQAPTGAMLASPTDLSQSLNALLQDHDTWLPDQGEFLDWVHAAEEAGQIRLRRYDSRPRSVTIYSPPRALRDDDGAYALTEADIAAIHAEIERRQHEGLLAAITPQEPRTARMHFTLTPTAWPEEHPHEAEQQPIEVVVARDAANGEWSVEQVSGAQLDEAERESVLRLARRFGEGTRLTRPLGERIVAGARTTRLLSFQAGALARNTGFNLRNVGVTAIGHDESNEDNLVTLGVDATGSGRVGDDLEVDLTMRAEIDVVARQGWPMQVRTLGAPYTEVSVSNTFQRLFILVLLAVSMIALYFLVNHTRPGKAMRAVSYDREAAKLMGINSDKVIQFTFFVGAFLAGMAGVYFGFVRSVEPMMGFFPGLKAFIAAVVGGIGSIPGAVVGGFLLAFIEVGVGSAARIAQLITGLPSSHPLIEFLGELRGFRDAIVFTLLILILVLKPEGLFGKPEGEKV